MPPHSPFADAGSCKLRLPAGAHRALGHWPAVKGWKGTRLFETGAQILKGLELASSYSWELAEQDLFNADAPLGDGSLLCTVLVGNSGYSGIAAVANKPGTDGTVRVSTANLRPPAC
ncbi:hypothetical protein ULG90_04305 [Halopseudomonas pachastrellae]|nr:hypothetical protein ULG90_04305 [Halopseudomonas pachastrellae]